MDVVIVNQAEVALLDGVLFTRKHYHSVSCAGDGQPGRVVGVPLMTVLFGIFSNRDRLNYFPGGAFFVVTQLTFVSMVVLLRALNLLGVQADR